MSWSSIPTFDDPCAQVNESVHKASGARLIEVLYGSSDAEGRPRAPRRGDGHGHLIAIELGEGVEPIVERAPLGPADEEELNKRAGRLADADRRDWDQAYKSELLRKLEHDLAARRRLCSRVEGLARGRLSTLKRVLDEVHAEWDGLRVWGVPVEAELIVRFDEANERCAGFLVEQQQNKVAKEALVAEAEALRDSTEWGKTNAAFGGLFDRWRAVGSAGRDEDQRLWEAFNDCRHDYYHRRDEHFKELRERQSKSREAKEALVEEARAVSQAVQQDWREAGVRMDELMERWKAAGSAGREHEQRLWDEFRTVRNEFSAARRAHFAELRERRQEIAEKKRRLVEEAAAIAQLEDYSHEQTERMKQLSVEWKEAGSAGHEADRALWAEFREAQDGFWDARRVELRMSNAERSGRLQSMVDRRQDQLENLYDQVDALRKRLMTTSNLEKQQEINLWISEKNEVIGRIETEVEEMRKRL